MTQQVINIGAAPNDGTGDPLRTCFSKANDNFTELYSPVASPVATAAGYHFHGFAPLQSPGSAKFYDISGVGNHGVFGCGDPAVSDLPVASVWAARGYASTLNPGASGARDTAIRIPGLNFDYAGGESMFGRWKGIVAPEGATVSFIGDGLSTSFPGFRVRLNTAGTATLTISDSTQAIFSQDSVVMANGTDEFSFAWVVDGKNKKYGMWVNDDYEHSLFDKYATFGAGQAVNTLNNNTFNIGSSANFMSNSSDGAASKTQSFVLIRLSPAENMPSVARMTAICEALDASPHKLVRQSALA